MTGFNKLKVIVRENTVEKTIRGDVQKVAEKYQALHKLSRESGFVAPTSISIDEARNMVILERIHGIRSIREPYREFMKNQADETAVLSMFERAGRALAWIHLKLIRPDASEWTPDTIFLNAVSRYGLDEFKLGEEEKVQLHCDYGFANVFIRERSGEEADIVIIDPCAEGYSTRYDWCCGPRYIDVGKMLLSLEGQVPLSWQPMIRRDGVRRLQNAFLDGYENVSGISLDRALCFSYAYAIGVCYFSSRYSPVGRLAAAVMYNRIWKRNFPLKRKLEWMAGNK